jgi:hypothetical protein
MREKKTETALKIQQVKEEAQLNLQESALKEKDRNDKKQRMLDKLRLRRQELNCRSSIRGVSVFKSTDSRPENSQESQEQGDSMESLTNRSS